MSGCGCHGDSCGASTPFAGQSAGYRRTLALVCALNAAMFVGEWAAGALAGSMALQADALDFAADAATYGLSLWAVGKAVGVRARVALIKAASLAAMGCGVLAATLWRLFADPSPEPVTMGLVGALALATNLTCFALLWRWRDGDANIRSVWLCTRNDAVGNVAVMIAAGAVAWSGTPWPDLIVAAAMATLFLSSALAIVRQARGELASAAATPEHPVMKS